ncbi:MAG: hypothetical protein FJ218_01525 [Ignavibacteria bacterium]|nr:hypothetical protein [Ignavibacteria bacterium]
MNVYIYQQGFPFVISTRLKKNYLLIFFLILHCTFFIVQHSFSQLGGTAGAFARMGFSSRGMGMGNAISALTSGEISTYYNPALSPFSANKNACVSYSFLSLDRQLNFLSYTQSVHPTAGFSLGLINQQVGNIDGRDADGAHTETYSTNENQFYLSFANKISKYVSIGLTTKIYYAKLYKEFTSTTVGFDAGILLRPKEQYAFAIVLQDLNSKYRWNSKALYNENGRETIDKFPTLTKFAFSYLLPEQDGNISAEYETSNRKTSFLRGGVEINLHEQFTVRGGADRIDINNEFSGMKPSFGFTVRPSISNLYIKIHYAYIFEPFAPSGAHSIAFSYSL